MSAISGGGNYISDGDIMSWLAIQQDRVYGDLKASMDLSGKRADFSDALNNIKSELQAANTDKNFKKVDAELQKLLSEYGSDPDFAKMCDGLKDMAGTIHRDYAVQQDYADKLRQQQELVSHALTVDPNGISAQDKDALQHLATALGTIVKPAELAPPKPQAYDDNTVKSWEDLLSGKGDIASKNDQLTMIHIQELKATIDQSSQLGSSFISSGDKTSNAIINNIA